MTQPGGSWPPPGTGWGTPPGGATPGGDQQATGWGTPPGGTTPGGAPQTTGWGTTPGYGRGPVPAPSDWHQLPPEQLARLHQPGVVPLRPLVMGDIFSGALQTMRRNPGATIGMGLVVQAVMLLPSLALSLLLVRLAASLPLTDLSVLTGLLSALFSTLSSVALTGMIMHVVGEAVLGDRAGLDETWRATRGRILPLLGNVLLLTLLTTVLAVGGVLALVLLVMAAVAADLTWVGVLLAVLGGLALLVLLLWAGARLSLAPAAVVLERMGPVRSFGRAWSLTRGGQGWRVTGITLLAGFVTSLFASLVQLPLVFAAALLLSPTGLAEDPVSPLMLGVDHLSQLVVGALTIPFTAGVTALLYLDQRMRREGLDVTLVRAAQERAAARQGGR